MIIVYAPADGDTHRWNLKQSRILATEAEAVERVTGLEWQAARGKVVKGSMLALRAVAWVLFKREQPTLKYSQFQPAAEELSYEYDAEERALIRRNIEEDDDLTAEEKAEILAEMDEEDAKLAEDEPAEAEDEAADVDDPEAGPKASATGASLTAG